MLEGEPNGAIDKSDLFQVTLKDVLLVFEGAAVSTRAPP